MDRLERMAEARAFAEANPGWYWEDRVYQLRRVASGAKPSSARVKLRGKTWVAYVSDAGWSFLRAPRSGNPKRFRSIAAAVKALGFTVNEPPSDIQRGIGEPQ